MRPETARSRRDRLASAAMTWAASGPPLGGAGTRGSRVFSAVSGCGLGGKKAPDGSRTRTSSSPVVAPVEAAAVPVAVSRGAVTQVRGHVGRLAAESELRSGEGRRQRRSGRGVCARDFAPPRRTAHPEPIGRWRGKRGFDGRARRSRPASGSVSARVTHPLSPPPPPGAGGRVSLSSAQSPGMMVRRSRVLLCRR
jgi:hypothetical protein